MVAKGEGETRNDGYLAIILIEPCASAYYAFDMH